MSRNDSKVKQKWILAGCISGDKEVENDLRKGVQVVIHESKYVITITQYQITRYISQF